MVLCDLSALRLFFFFFFFFAGDQTAYPWNKDSDWQGSSLLLHPCLCFSFLRNLVGF